MSFIKAILFGQVINQGRKIYSVWPKKMWRRCYVLADFNIFAYEVLCIFWHYINVDEVSWITLKKLLESVMELLKIATAFLLQSATRFITNCDRYYKVRWICYKLRQVLQSAMIITNCDGTSPPGDYPQISAYKLARLWRPPRSSHRGPRKEY